ncbi:hypothetical protein DsansV1_C05g0054791 [Dioscorea sansibarensis]
MMLSSRHCSLFFLLAPCSGDSLLKFSLGYFSSGVPRSSHVLCEGLPLFHGIHHSSMELC